MATALERGWQYLTDNFTEFQLASFGSFIIHEGVFFLSGLPYLFMEMWGMKKYKIQSKMNAPEAQTKCIVRLLVYHTCVNLPLMVLSYPVFTWMGMSCKLPLPSWKVVAFQIASFLILEDFIFYWGHRILHTKWLYKHIHSVHHEYATPFGLTSEYAHPAEILFLGFATFFGPIITGPHLFTTWLWMIIRVLETVEAHCGYDFPWSLSKIFPLYGGRKQKYMQRFLLSKSWVSKADFHDYHHRLLYTKSGNYASTFTYMDWIFGTDKGYRKLKSLKQGTEVSEEFLVRNMLDETQEDKTS
ncbi:hypothetical protein KP509_39G025500 [Ceratopteris richardii]|uniref:Fatty acid hydroxylase domain-containing protein n=1 Tax=Ceratopteris richardii TaxID=49495 RepID=A0A8T2PZM0_CERRI|nr:hypothetical protein KP509_39G025500 [Ceratopteris richardii]